MEKGQEFDPTKIEPRQNSSWVTLGGGTPSFATQHPTAESTLNGAKFDIESLPLRDPGHFISGQLHQNLDKWKEILEANVMNDDLKQNIEGWLNQGVDVRDFFSHFKGNFKGRSYDCNEPPTAFFQNNISCKDHESFVCHTLSEKIRSGSIKVIGKVGECQRPKVVMPLTVEPSKPRLCLDARFLNLWIRDSPFRLETLNDVHRLVDSEAWMATCDEKAGYEHVALSKDSQNYFGIEFGGYFMVYTVIPFGWKASPYVYQSIGMTVTSYLRKLSVNTTQYIDDCLVIANSKGKTDSEVREECSRVAYALIEILTRLGYTISLRKSCLEPSKHVKFLGFFIDSIRLAYILPEEKKLKFIELRESILAGRMVSVKTLQRFAGKCVSMGLAIPGAKLYCREVNGAISSGVKNSRNIVIHDNLREELEYWRFLDSWTGCSKWRSESHKQVRMSTDASGYKYGAVVYSNEEKIVMGDFWDQSDERSIHLKEAEAILRVLESLKGLILDSRVDLLTDNMAVLSVWERQGGRDRSLNEITKRIFELVTTHNCDLHMQYVPSESNEADAPSRTLNYSDACLSENAWQLVEEKFGPHTVDLMSLDSNVMKSKDGTGLRHFTPFPTPSSSGVNVFAHNLSGENAYVYPPFALIHPVLLWLKEQKVGLCTCVVPLMRPLPVWWPLIRNHEVMRVIIGSSGDKAVIRVPSKRGFILDNKGLRWSLVAFRLLFP